MENKIPSKLSSKHFKLPWFNTDTDTDTEISLF